MSLDEAKIDWAVVGKSAKDPNQSEVLIASVPNTFSEQRLDLVEDLTQPYWLSSLIRWRYAGHCCQLACTTVI